MTDETNILLALALVGAEAHDYVIEKMLAECLPSGQTCDPQKVADDIREWFDTHCHHCGRSEENVPCFCTNDE